MKSFRKYLITAVLAALFSAPLHADFKAGLTAYEKGDYAEAFKQYKEAANAGDPDAYGKLAGMYLYGVGTEKDYTKAYIWFGMAEDSGDDFAEKFQMAASSAMTPKQVEAAEKTLAEYRKRLEK